MSEIMRLNGIECVARGALESGVKVAAGVSRWSGNRCN